METVPIPYGTLFSVSIYCAAVDCTDPSYRSLYFESAIEASRFAFALLVTFAALSRNTRTSLGLFRWNARTGCHVVALRVVGLSR